MQSIVGETIGIAAAVASLYAAYAKTMIPLRAAAIAASILAMIAGFLAGSYPAVVLNVALVGLHAWRLGAMLALIRAINAATRSDMNVDWLLPYTRPKRFKAGDIVMQSGEYATAAFYVVSGEVEIVETNEVLRDGVLLGEIGLFTPSGRRTMTVRCRTDVQTAQLDYDQFKQLYFQNPEFGFHLLQLIVARLRANPELARAAASP
jgi:hypothetical protein